MTTDDTRSGGNVPEDDATVIPADGRSDDTAAFGQSDAAPGPGVTRRRALQVLAASAAAAAALPAAACAPGEESVGGRPEGASVTSGSEDAPRAGANPLARNTPTDPDLLAPIIDWELVLTEEELEKLAVLCDVIVPADEHSPSASAVGAHEFINEWVSAPYEGNERDLTRVRGGLVWLDRESRSRFDSPFADLTDAQKTQICDDICYEPNASEELKSAARFFDRVRDLTSTAFWTTEEGMADLGFVGNVPMGAFEGPPREVLERLGLV
ncbi:MAG: gluconate 2-dehydrogenase subunit 3 family protein [Gemmatimonadota bacterium]|nr:gluconate 2-dehydrogenase subunit 3 family protein [Gemmatimonadota bacterium]